MGLSRGSFPWDKKSKEISVADTCPGGAGLFGSLACLLCAVGKAAAGRQGQKKPPAEQGGRSTGPQGCRVSPCSSQSPFPPWSCMQGQRQDGARGADTSQSTSDSCASFGINTHQPGLGATGLRAPLRYKSWVHLGPLCKEPKKQRSPTKTSTGPWVAPRLDVTSATLLSDLTEGSVLLPPSTPHFCSIHHGHHIILKVDSQCAQGGPGNVASGPHPDQFTVG